MTHARCLFQDEAELRNALGHNEANSGAVSNTAAKPVKRKTVQNKTFTRKKAFSVINQQHIDLNKLSSDTLTGACSSEGAVVPSDVCLYDAVINDGQVGLYNTIYYIINSIDHVRGLQLQYWVKLLENPEIALSSSKCKRKECAAID